MASPIILYMELDWKKYLKEAYLKAQEGTNPSTQNGAILINDKGEVLVAEKNNFSDNVAETPERLSVKPTRYRYGVHAERNVIYRAAKAGIKTNGLTMVCSWAACMDCAQGIIQSGIKRLVTHKQALDRSGNWQDEIDTAFAMLREAGVEIIIYDGSIGIGKVLRSGEHWEP